MARRTQHVGMIGPLLTFACAVCAAPTPPAPDVAPREAEATLDASVDVRVGGLELGTGTATARVDERRIEPRVGFAPVSEAHVWVGVPVLARSVRSGGDLVEVLSLGDVELGVDTTLVNEREGLRGALVLGAAVKTPTAPVSLDAHGDPLPSGLQAGCSSVVPVTSIAYVFGERFWDVRLGAAVLLPFAIREAPHRGAIVDGGGELSLRPLAPLTFHVGSRLVLEATGEGIGGVTEPDSGGLTHRVTAGIDVTHRNVVGAGLSVDVPAGTALRGHQAPTPIFGVRASGVFAL